MAKVDYKGLCQELARNNNHVAVLGGNDQHGRPVIDIAAVVNACQVNMNGRAYWGLVCVSIRTEEVKWYPYNEVVGYKKEGKACLDGLDRCLEARYCWMDRTEAMDTREVVQLTVEDFLL